MRGAAADKMKGRHGPQHKHALLGIVVSNIIAFLILGIVTSVVRSLIDTENDVIKIITVIVAILITAWIYRLMMPKRLSLIAAIALIIVLAVLLFFKLAAFGNE